MRHFINAVDGSIFSQTVSPPVFETVGELDGLTVATTASGDASQTLYLVTEGQSVSRVHLEPVHDLPLSTSAYRVTGLQINEAYADRTLPLYEWIVKNACDYILDDLDGDRSKAMVEAENFDVHRCDRHGNIAPVETLAALNESLAIGAAILFSAAAGHSLPSRPVTGTLMEAKLRT